MESFDGFEFGSAYKGEPVEEIGGVLLPEDYLAFMREHNGGDGGGELYCVDEKGRYYNVPAMIDKEDLTCLGDTFEDFIKNAVALWEGDD
jgi:hypothetical protein